jgi:hypothetical protein
MSDNYTAKIQVEKSSKVVEYKRQRVRVVGSTNTSAKSRSITHPLPTIKYHAKCQTKKEEEEFPSGRHANQSCQYW